MSMDSSFWLGPPSEPDTYQLISTLGSGGEGQVWKAVVPLSDAGRRQVAIKILPMAGWVNDQEWARFGHLLKTLSHPGLVRVSDVFTGPAMHRGQLQPPPGSYRYVVMDFVEGMTLAEWLAENPDAAVTTRIALLRTVAAALDEMHSGRATEVPVAHGDVKPANIIIKPDGGTVLVDLGLARLSDSTGASGRTNPYAAPELHVPGAQVTPESDRFAFVATLAHLLLGQPPPLDHFGMIDLAALEQALRSNPITARRPALVRAIMTALAASPQARPRQLGEWLAATTGTVSQVTSDVAPQQIYEGRGSRPVVAVAPPPPGPPPGSAPIASPTPVAVSARRLARRRWLPLTAAAVVLVVAAAAFAVGFFVHRPTSTSTSLAGASTVTQPAATKTVTGPASTITVGGADVASTVTVTTAIPTTVTETAVESAASNDSGSPAGGGTAPMTAASTAPIAAGLPLLDIPQWQTSSESLFFITAGQTLVNGVKYQKSFTLEGCQPQLIVPVKAGQDKFLTGRVTYEKTDPQPDGEAVVWTTTDQQVNRDSEWVKRENIVIQTGVLTPFKAAIPADATGIRINADSACGPKYVVIDPVLS